MAQFSDGTIPVLFQSVAREYLLAEEHRRIYATELLDFYHGFGKKYIQNLIDLTIKSLVIKSALKNLIVPYPLLQSFIDDISMVYKEQPKRTFYLEGKEVVAEIDDRNGIIDKSKYKEDRALLDRLEKIYSDEFCMKIEAAEELTNLLTTTVFKINNREQQLRFDFIPNDVISIAENLQDTTQMDQIIYLLGLVRKSDIDLTNVPIYERWTTSVKEIIKGGVKEGVEPNRAADIMREYFDNPDQEHVGSGIPPFVVLRSSLSSDTFWNVRDRDTLDVIKQIILALTEIRYLQQYGSFGLKYIIGGKLSKSTTFDLRGVWEIESTEAHVPGQTPQKVDVGELKNEGRMDSMVKSVYDLIRLLFVLSGLNTDHLRGSKDAESAESKQLDREDIKQFLQKKRKMWTYNEGNIFRTLICVYNRDNSDVLPKGLEIKINFADIEIAAEEMEKKLNNWLAMIDNNVKTQVDLIREIDPDLNKEEAERLLEFNKQFNAKSVTPEDEDELGLKEDEDDEENKKDISKNK